MILIDTGAFLARYIAQDQFHAQSLRLWDRLEKRGGRFFTSNFILNETLTLLARRVGYEFAAEKAQIFFSSTALSILRPSEEEESMAIHFFRKYADQEVSFTDCLSFALMRRKNIEEVFSFDRHFEIAGFKILK